jgi:hypothetical protein
MLRCHVTASVLNRTVGSVQSSAFELFCPAFGIANRDTSLRAWHDYRNQTTDLKTVAATHKSFLAEARQGGQCNRSAQGQPASWERAQMAEPFASFLRPAAGVAGYRVGIVEVTTLAFAC